MKLLKQLTDTELISRFQQGNQQAFHELYHRYQQKIFGIVLYYIKDRVIAEDLCQEAYIKIIMSIKSNKYCEEGKFLPWALRIVHNHCMDYLRKNKTVSYVTDFSDQSLVHLTSSSPETKMVKQQAAVHLHQLLNKLSYEQRKVVYYRHFEELSFKEISKLTGSSINTTLGRMRYAMMHLRNLSKSHPAFV